MKLAKLQNKFIDTIYDKPSPEVLSEIKEGKISATELLDIYRNNLYQNLTNALSVTYPKTRQKIGSKKFTQKCEKFIKENRSQSGNLDDYGEGFGDIVEWLRLRSYLALDTKVLDIKKLQKLPPEKLLNLKFKLHPSCFLHQNLLIYRQDLEVKTTRIRRDELNFLRGIIDGLSFFEICEKHAIDIQKCLQKSLEKGLICGFRTS